MKMAHGGSRPGAGRPKGAQNKRTKEQVEAVMASGLTPLEYLLGVLRDELAAKEDRMDAAKAAAQYVHPRLSSVEAKVDASLTYEERLRRIADGD